MKSSKSRLQPMGSDVPAELPGRDGICLVLARRAAYQVFWYG